MTNEIYLTVMGGTAPQDVRVDTGIKRLKPQLVHWAWSAWDKLTRKQELVKDGWSRCGLADVLDAAQQREAMRFCMSNKEQAPGVEVEDELTTGSDGEEEAVEGVECEGPTESD